MNYREQLTADPTGPLRIWDHPTDGREYVAGLDASEGKKRDRTALQRRGLAFYSDQRVDYSAICVIELESGMHVATWHGYVPPEELAGIAVAVCVYYNNALLVPELNGPGLAVVTRVTETLRYDNVYRSTMVNMIDMDPLLPRYGWQTTTASRKILMMRVGEALAEGGLFTRDEKLVSELRTMEFDDQGVERARGKNKDDCVFAYALARQGRYTAIVTDDKRPKPAANPERAFDAKVWAMVKQMREQREQRTHGTNGYRPVRTGGLPRGVHRRNG